MHPVRPLVAVKCKSGELEALKNLRSRGAPQARVMVELLDSASTDGKVLPALVRAAVIVAELGRPLWLDTTWLTSRSPLEQQPGGVLEYLDDRIETESGLFAPDLPSLVPVVPLDASTDELRRVRRLIDHKDRDIAIRIHDPGTSTLDLGRRILSIMQSTGTQPGHVHAVVDAGFVETVRADQAAAVAKVAATALDLLGPGSTTLLAGSIPAVRKNYDTVLLDRPEVTLWNEVRDDRACEVNYGDYGVTHPRPPKSDGNARNPHPYLCYTVPKKTVVLRRKQKEGEVPGELFADLAEELVERADFAGPDYSWGDGELARCRPAGGRTAGAVSRWVAMATSHHLEHVSRRAATDL